MPEGRFAQQLIGLVTTPERAESAVGDLLEQADARGQLWFWRSILQLAAVQTFTSQGRRSLSLLPAMLDTTLYITAIWFVSKKFWWPGYLIVSWTGRSRREGPVLRSKSVELIHCEGKLAYEW